MRIRSAFVALPAIALAQVITVTAYPDSCKATYTTAVTYTATSSGSRTSTVVQSTVTVVPTPFTDSSINEGTPFAIEIQPAGYSKNKRQAQGSRTFLDIDGYLTSDASEAVQYVINNGQIRISGGQGQVTADETDLSVPFAASTVLKSSRTTFYSANLQLGWNNSAFDGGAAEFFQVQNGSSTRIVVHLNGVHDASWIAVDFALKPTSELAESSTVAPVPSATGSVSIQPISTTAASASATPSGNVDPGGVCGVGTDNNNCFGAPDGSCCSQYGFCGSGPEFCGTGCQVGFGICDSAESSAVPTSSWIQVPTTIAGSSTWTSVLVPAGSSAVQPPMIGSSTASASSIVASPPSYESSTSVVPLPGWSSTVALTIPPIVTSSSANSASVPLSSSADLPPPVYSPPAVSTSVSLSFSTSGSVTFTSTSLVSVTSTQETYSGPVSTPIVPSQYPTIASEEPWYTGPIGTPSVSFSLVETGSSLAPIYSSLASSYASSTSSEVSSWSSVISSVASSIGATPSSLAPSSTSLVPVASSSAAASSMSSMSSSISSAVSSLESSRTSSIFSSTSSAASSEVSSVLSAAQSPPMFTSLSSTTSFAAVTTSSPASITSSGPAPVGTGVGRCPDDNGILATDANGEQYVVGCSADFRGTDLTSTRITSPYNSCYTICADLPNCGGYIWAGIDGSSNGVGTGYCYFKQFSGQGNFVPASNTLIAVVKPVFISGYTVPTNAPPAYTSDAEVTPTPGTSAPIVFPSQASSCAVTAVPNPQFYASDTASRASSWLVLPSPTPCPFTPPPADWPLDDDYCDFSVPQGLELYGSRFTTLFASTNGVIAFGEGTAQYENQRLPTEFVPPFALAPFWDDQAMYGNADPPHGIYYQADDTGVTVEFYLSRAYVDNLMFHYTVSYSFANPGVYVFSYFDVDSANNDLGKYATVGMQGAPNNVTQSFEYSWKTQSIYPGLVLTCDSNRNICTACSQAIQSR
ncbi:putative chitin-binding, type 1, Endochitinase-like superfamily [Septoria linicola]|nr:putative chitin-binding, type 1, Endochitinase-like superfamily [Septoria linicola]